MQTQPKPSKKPRSSRSQRAGRIPPNLKIRQFLPFRKWLQPQPKTPDTILRQSAITTIVLAFIGLTTAFLLGTQLRVWISPKKQYPFRFEEAFSNVYRIPIAKKLGWSPAKLQLKAAELFATPDSVGTIALGAAEGTRTHYGHRTSIWHRHTDPGNGATNRGTFSWQLGGARTPEAADRLGLRRIQTEAIPALIQDAIRAGVELDMETLIQGADLWNQSPDAGADFVHNLRSCSFQNLPSEDELLLCARIASFYDPTTGELEAAGFGWDSDWLAADQQRRIAAIKQVLEVNQHKLKLDEPPK